MHSLAVFLASKDSLNPIYASATKQLGQAIAARNIRLIYGAANGGLMGILARTVLNHGGEVIGIIPHSSQNKEKPLAELTELIWVDNIAKRIALMHEFADGFMVLPGGLGTMEELFTMWNKIRLGLSDKPLGILNINEYYTPLLQFIAQIHQQGFVNHHNTQIPIVSDEPNTLLSRMYNHPYV